MQFRYRFPADKFGRSEDPEKTLGADWPEKFFEAVLGQVVSRVFPQGVRGGDSRTLNRVLNALDATAGQDFLILEKAEVEFLHRIFTHNDAAVPPGMVRAFCLYQDAAIEALHAN